ncbi:uncharacterized protein B0H18DRAFT_242953 [Fomitopsis serialis]|uniref:uncharacterized protein n=1 Tax=Fomitopsis serialis TaxID=139415 RepID=UPI002007CBF7|nr:uncharacterized protein B0H18DRAFT_242953 [Neoantrodia serialis]KAH9928622.1 hypothetical protein B0H18DRAFT_242953 [Neoantrodia serialis]
MGSSSALTAESTYNMDPTSLVLIALDLYDIRGSHEEAFEYFMRAWHQARVPSATIRLATHYLPVQCSISDSVSDTTASTESVDSASVDTEPTTPTPSIIETSYISPPSQGTPGYYLDRIGGAPGLAELFLSAGILHLEGAAAPLLSSAYAGLSSLRTPLVVSGSTGRGNSFPASSTSPGGTEGWRRDRECARRYFERARALVPSLDVPLLPPQSDSDAGSGIGSGAENGDRRSTGSRSGPASSSSGRQSEKVRPEVPSADPPQAQPRRRRRKEASSGDLSSSFMENYRSSDTDAGDEDRTWYLYVPGLVARALRSWLSVSCLCRHGGKAREALKKLFNARLDDQTRRKRYTLRLIALIAVILDCSHDGFVCRCTVFLRRYIHRTICHARCKILI